MARFSPSWSNIQRINEAIVRSKAYMPGNLAGQQVAAHGVVGFMRGIRFPIVNGYITLHQLVSEGAEIGTILVGTQRFSVQVVVTSPPPACAPAK